MTITAVDTLAKVDLCCHFDGALSPGFLAKLALARGLPEGTDAQALQDRLQAKDLTSLLTARDWVRSLFTTGDELHEAALDLGRRLVTETVVHVELFVDPTAFAATGLAPAEVLRILDAGLMLSVTEEEDERFLSWVLVPELRRDQTAEEAETLVRSLLEAELERVGGIAVSGEGEAGLTALHLAGALNLAREAGLGRVVAAGDHGPKERVLEAIEMGAQRLTGATAALKDPALLLQLRAHRTPVVVLPTWQVTTAAARSMNSLPLRKLKEAGVFMALGTGWPTLLGTSMTGELEQMARWHHWRLDDMRNATTRAIEAAFMAPNLRFHLARRIEIWRHRPLAGPPNKSDNWSM
jgi:adenosine deaminase